MILADSSVWIDHLRKGDPQLADLLLREQIVMHTMVLGELACGSLKDRERVLLLWRRLPRLEAASDEIAVQFLERHRLMSAASVSWTCTCWRQLRSGRARVFGLKTGGLRT